MTTDPVCGMLVNEDNSEFKSDYHGETFYFCSMSCKEKFDKSPEKYAEHKTHQPVTME